MEEGGGQHASIAHSLGYSKTPDNNDTEKLFVATQNVIFSV